MSALEASGALLPPLPAIAGGQGTSRKRPREDGTPPFTSSDTAQQSEDEDGREDDSTSVPAAKRPKVARSGDGTTFRGWQTRDYEGRQPDDVVEQVGRTR